MLGPRDQRRVESSIHEPSHDGEADERNSWRVLVLICVPNRIDRQDPLHVRVPPKRQIALEERTRPNVVTTTVRTNGRVLVRRPGRDQRYSQAAQCDEKRPPVTKPARSGLSTLGGSSVDSHRHSSTVSQVRDVAANLIDLSASGARSRRRLRERLPKRTVDSRLAALGFARLPGMLATASC